MASSRSSRASISSPDWASGPLYRVDAQGNVVRLLDLHQGTADLTFLPETKTILIPLMLENALVAYKLE